MKPLLGPFLAAAVLVSLPWLARATPPEAAKRQPTASFSMPDKPVEGRMVLRNRTVDALATQTRGLFVARPDIRWRIIGESSEEHTSELQSLMRIPDAGFVLAKRSPT